MEIEFYPIDVDSVIHKGRSMIRVFGKTVAGERICVIDKIYKPYFYIIVEDGKEKKVLEKIKDLEVKHRDRVIKVIDAKIEKRIYIGKEVSAIKVTVNDYMDIPELSSEIKQINHVVMRMELDIPFHRRYLVDKEIVPLVLCKVEGEKLEHNLDVDYLIKAEKIEQVSEAIINKLRILSIDIECYNKKKAPDEEQDPVIMISFYGNDGFKKVIAWKRFKNSKKYVEFVDNERLLIEKFKEIIRTYKPDYLIGYFTDGFDLPYIKTRASKYGIKLDLGLDYSNIKVSRRAEMKSVFIKGIAHIDVFRFVKGALATGIKSDRFDLGSIAQELVGDVKKDVDIENLWKYWDSSSEKLNEFAEYCLHDSILAMKIFEKINSNLNEFVKIVGQPVANVARMTFGQMVEWHLFRFAKKFNQLIPSRPLYDEIARRQRESYEGAFVYQPEPGIYENVVVFDFRSLYPSIITAHNIDPGTLTDEKKNCHETPEIVIGEKKEQYYFTSKFEGFIPSVLKDVIIRRNRVKEILNKEKKKDAVLLARREALKILVNSFYGYLGFSGARWYSNECAAGVAAYGRYYIKRTMDLAEKAGFKVIYGDTDSLTLVLGKKTEKDALRFLKDINNSLPSLMELELEDFYPRGIFVSKKSEKKGAKKKYALINKEGELKIIGFETIRGDWSFIAKEVQKKVLEIILKENNVKKAVEYVKDIIKKIRDKKIPLEKMVIVKQLRKEIKEYETVGPHVEVAKRLQELGYYVGPGTTIGYVVNEGSGIIRERAKLLEESKSYDAVYYVENQVIPAVIPILWVLGVKEEDLKEDHKQRKLGEY